MSSTEYILYRQYFSHMINRNRARHIMIQIRIDELLKTRERSFYWLAKQTGISHTTLWRLKKRKALGINFETLERMCRTLKCQPGDMLFHVNGQTTSKRETAIETRKKKVLTELTIQFS